MSKIDFSLYDLVMFDLDDTLYDEKEYLCVKISEFFKIKKQVVNMIKVDKIIVCLRFLLIIISINRNNIVVKTAFLSPVRKIIIDKKLI